MEVNTTNFENFISPNSTLSTPIISLPVPVIVINNTSPAPVPVPVPESVEESPRVRRVRVPNHSKLYFCKFCLKYTTHSKGTLNNHLNRCLVKVLKNRSKNGNGDGSSMLGGFESDLLEKFSLLSKKPKKSTRGESPLPPTLDLEGYTDSDSDCYSFSSEKAGPSNSNRSFSHFKRPSPYSSSNSKSKFPIQSISKEWQIIPSLPSPFHESSASSSPSSISSSPSQSPSWGLGLSTDFLSPSIESPSVSSSNNVHQPPIKLKLQIKPPVLAPEPCINNIRALQLPPPVATVRPISRTTSETISNKVPFSNNTFKKYKNKRKRKENTKYKYRRSYECDIDNCKFTTAYLTNLKTHKRRHTGERPYNCSVCPYRAAIIGSIKIHERATHKFGDKIFECRLCQFKPPLSAEKKWMELKCHLAEIHRLTPAEYYQLKTSSSRLKLKSKSKATSNPVVPLVLADPVPVEASLTEPEPDGSLQAEVAKIGEGQRVESIYRGDEETIIMTEFERSAGSNLQSSGSFQQSQTIPAVAGRGLRDPPVFNWVAEPPADTDSLYFVCALCDLQIESLDDCYNHSAAHNANSNNAR